uniref:Uncharacterized protein n=1 Tax=Nothobranchius pienaari TaxID=704102 RepID=A0A1A8N3T6_9TELE
MCRSRTNRLFEVNDGSRLVIGSRPLPSCFGESYRQLVNMCNCVSRLSTHRAVGAGKREDQTQTHSRAPAGGGRREGMRRRKKASERGECDEDGEKMSASSREVEIS